jgi:hypothetical protein
MKILLFFEKIKIPKKKGGFLKLENLPHGSKATCLIILVR